MSTLKRVISLVLCAAILAGSFALVGSVALAEELSGAPLEGTNIDSYESLVAKYGTNKDKQGRTDGFVYVGTEVIEKDGKITDYYVKPGDELTVRIYIKSNMYVGESYIMSRFDNKFFDVKFPAGETETVDPATGYTSNYNSGVKNNVHPMVLRNNITHTITSAPIVVKDADGNNKAKLGWIHSLCDFGFDKKNKDKAIANKAKADELVYLSGFDIVQSNTLTDVNQSNEVYIMDSDEWLFSYTVKVKEGLADGTKGVMDSPETLWQSSLDKTTGKHMAGKKVYVPVKHPETETPESLKQMNVTMAAQMDSGALDHVIIDDMYHEFIIGEGEASKYTATFYAEDQTTVVLQNKEYEVGQKVEFPAAVKDQIGWAIVREGVTAPGTILYPAADGTYDYTAKEADVDFLRILKTSTFPVKFGLGQNTIPGEPDPETGRPTYKYDVTVNEDKLPKGMKFIKEEWVLQIDLPIGQPFDLKQIPADAVVKEGNEITGWDTKNVAPPSKIEGTVITLNAVNGAMGSDITVSSKAIWNPKHYSVNYYLNKEAFESGAEPIKTITGLLYGAQAKYGEGTTKIDDKNPDQKFAGWVDADSGKLISSTDSINLIYNKNLNLYATWSDYKNSATFMARDYATGEWVEVASYTDRIDKDTATLSASTIKEAIGIACAENSSLTFQYLFTANPDEIKDGKYDDFKVKGAFEVQPGNYAAENTTYSGHQIFYIATTLACEVTWKAPLYDEKTNKFDEENATVIVADKVSTAVYAGEGIDPFKATSKLTQSVAAPTGYALAGWKNAATGEAVTLDKNGAFVIDAKTKSATLIAVYELVKYPVAFNLRNSDSPDVVMLDGTITLGGSIEIKDAKFTLNGKESVLPAIGVANDKQADGGYVLPEGYKFAGWTLGYGSGATKVDFPVKLTAQMIRENFANGAIYFNGTWEAQEYTLSFYITNAKNEEELFATYNVKAGADIASYRNVTAETAAAINAKAVEGKVFSNIWYNKETNAADTTLTRMPAKNVSYYAVYSTATVKVYVDYNHLAEKDLKQSMDLFKIDGKEILLYGADTSEVKEEAPYYSRSFQTVVMRSPIPTTFRPADESEVIGWNIYHVGAGEDPFTAEWKPGINDDGSAIAKTTLIFQPIWLAHKDMFFRIYDTDGNLAHALGKNLKTYFWNNGEIVESSKETAINRNTELYIAYILTMSIENWDWSQFFNIEMWQSLTIRFDPFPIPRSWLTWEGMKGIFEAIGNALGSLL